MKGTWEIVLSGVGGQGLLSIGNLLGEAASIFGGKKATMTASYGVETRGTFTKSDVIISDEEIDFPEVLNPDIVLCLAQVSYDRYRNTEKHSCKCHVQILLQSCVLQKILILHLCGHSPSFFHSRFFSLQEILHLFLNVQQMIH